MIRNVHLKGWLSINSAAAYAEVSRRTLSKWINDEGLEHVRKGKTVRIKPEWLDAFLMRFHVDSKADLERIVQKMKKEALQ